MEPYFTSVLVTTPEQELFAYNIRIKGDMPSFQFLPAGREIMHRLAMKAALTSNVDDLIPPFEKTSLEIYE